MNPAEQAAERTLAAIYECIKQHRNFLLEAGAGAGKTYSLVQSLNYLIENQGTNLLRHQQQIACITYTNVASDEIKERTDGHPVILTSTVHAFCWSLIKDFQPILREKVPLLKKWPEKLEEVGGICTQKIEYELGYRSVDREKLLLGHNDVLSLAVMLMEYQKFRNIFTSRYPILFIDEYQDTNKEFAEALKMHFFETGKGPLIGLFGDHWQKIYGDGCGKISSPNLVTIDKGANFRSVKTVVDVLNRIRPELEQAVKDPESEGSVSVYHTNEWTALRRTESHWKDDLPAKIVHCCLSDLELRLKSEGWDFSPEKTKILMLTHNVLASEQGYDNLASVFPYNDAFIKKENPYIRFFVDTLEPVCIAYQNKRYGEMFAALGGHLFPIRTPNDKIVWSQNMDSLLDIRATQTIGEVISHLRKTRRPRLPDDVEQKEIELEKSEESNSDAEESTSIKCLRELKKVPYKEVIALAKFIDEKTPFSTKHGVKGAEFENVMVIFGRGWNLYNFNQFLEWAPPNNIPAGKEDAYERNRNLFYVTCSRPKKRLALFFTQKLSDQAIETLSRWFGSSNIHAFNGFEKYN